MPSAGKPGNDARHKKLELVSCAGKADRVESAGNFFLISREQSGLPLPLLFCFRILSFSVGREAILLSAKLKIDLFRCWKKKIFYPKKIFTFSQVTQRNFSWESLRVRIKIDPMLRPEYIFNPLHQGRTYSPENNIFCITVDIYLLTEGRVGKLEVKKHEGRVGSETL